MAKVSIRNVEKYYGKVHAVKGINIEINDREFFCLLGPSGCGKSTTLRMLAGLETISKGEIAIDDVVVNDLAPKDRDVAMVFENYALYTHKNVFENIAFPLRVRKMTESEVTAGVRKAAKILEIEELLDRGVTQLSGGQKQRVAIGRAIVRNPKVFLMDEPISHLDAKLRTHMRGELKHLQRVLKTTMIYVTHDQLEAISMADRIVIMNLGEVQQIGTPDEVFNKPANVFVADFIGDPPMNSMDCHVRYEEGKLFIENTDVKCDMSAKMAQFNELSTDYSADNSLVMGIRPENVNISLKKIDIASAKGKVYVTSPAGKDTVISVEVGKHHIKTIQPSDFNVEMGKTVWLDFDPEKVHLFDKSSGKRILK